MGSYFNITTFQGKLVLFFKQRKLQAIYSTYLMSITLLGSLILPTYSFSQQFAQFKTIAQKDGLSNDFVKCLLQDHKGFIWIGTENGLNRYDGYQVTIFKNDPADVESLQGNWINVIHEDSQHNLLIGTNKGLNFLNPETNKFERINLDTAQTSNKSFQILGIQEDANHHLWVATAFNGLIHLSPQSKKENNKKETIENWAITHYIHQPNNPNSLSSNNLAAILFDKNRYLWIATTSEIQRLDIESNQLETFKPSPSLTTTGNVLGIEELFLDKDGKIIFNSPSMGLYRIDQPNSVPLSGLHSPFFKNVTLPLHLSEKGQISISIIDHDWLWVFTVFDLYKVNRATGNFISYTHHLKSQKGLPIKLFKLLNDDKGNLWLGTYGMGTHLLTTAGYPFQHYEHQIGNPSSISINQVRSIVKDNAGFLWVATLGGGMDKMKFVPNQGWVKVANWQEETLNSTINYKNHIIHLIKSSSGKLWMANRAKSLISLNPQNNQLQIFEQQSANTFDYEGIWSLCEDRLGNIWMGTRNQGVHRLNPITGALTNFSINPEWTKTIANKFVYHIYEDSLGQLWFCTAKGLYFFNPKNKKITEFLLNSKEALADDWVWTVFEDSKNNIWIGTNGGLNKYDHKTKKLHAFYDKDGLPSNTIWGIVEDMKKRLWVSTDAGLARCRDCIKQTSSNESSKPFRPYTRQSGLFGDTFLPHAYFKDEETGQLYFGGLHGFDIVVPEQMKSDSSPPKMFLSSLSVTSSFASTKENRKDYLIANKEKISLHYLDDLLNFTFSDLNFQGYDNNFYEYQLSGLSEQWIPLAANKTMTFIDLNPGSYSLKIKGKTPDGALIQEKELVNLVIPPPFWQTWWAYSIYFLCLLFALWRAYQFQLNRQFEKQESHRLKELDKVKSQLYTNITHEFRTPLTVISGIAEQLEGNPKNKLIIKRNSNLLLNLVNQMLDLRKLKSGNMPINKQQDDIIKFIKYLTASLKSHAESNNCTIHFLADEKSLLMDFDAEKITRIYLNLLSNAIKFTPKGGAIYIHLFQEIQQENHQFVLKIRDTGIGIPEDQLPHIFDRFYQVKGTTKQGDGTGIGLTLAAELIWALGGTIQVKSALEEGTIFTIILPITNTAKLGTQIPHLKVEQSVGADLTVRNTDLKETLVSIQDNSSKPVVLIIEDNADIIHYLIACLKDNYSIEVAMDGEEGIDKAVELIPDVIISDVMMPKKDGFEVCQTLKSDERTSHIPILLLTAKSDLSARLEGFQKGADAYLNKPFHEEELLLILQNQLILRKKLQVRFRQLSTASITNQETLLIEKEGIEIKLEVEDAFLQKIKNLIEKNLSKGDIGMPQLMRHLGMSRSQIYKKVKALTGHSPSIYIRSIRLYHAKKLLIKGSMNVSEVAYEVGFTSPAYFSNVFFEEFGYRPIDTPK